VVELEMNYRIKKKLFSKSKIIKVASIIAFLLPRLSFTYPFYLIPSLIAVRATKKQVSNLLILLSICIICCIASSFQSEISITAFVLSVILQLPFFLFLFGFELKQNVNALSILRYINVFTLILSLVNMTGHGFPFQLPYINFAPDFYSAFYGQGGAKIVTVIGFFGFASEIFSERKSFFTVPVIVSLLNFIVPNYLVGIIVGLAALIIVSIKRSFFLITIIFLIILIIAPYAEDRFAFLNNNFANTVGYNPKIFAYFSILFLFLKFPLTIFSGTSLGQFTSTPALWASQYISSLSTHDIPNLPGLFMSGYHEQILGPVLSSLSNDVWSLSSSANKPYTSISTIIAEYGVLISIVIFILFFRAFKKMNLSKKFTVSIFLFVLLLFATDLWHDNLWLGYLLILSKDISKEVIQR
jgi:hypothetical protein